MAETVGMIGIGLLGTALAERLLGAGFQVLGHDIDAGKREALVKLGGEAAPTIGDVARRCDRIVFAVLSVAQVEDAIEGDGGLLANVGEGPGPKIVLCCSTCEPDRVAALAERAAARGVVILDTPVSGSSQQVGRGEGLGLIAGDPVAARSVNGILDALYPRRHFVGAAGDASKAKLAINLVLGINRLALAEGLVFGEGLGLDPAALLGVLRDSAAYSQIMDIKGVKMVAGDVTPQGKISQGLKDVRIMLAEAEGRGQVLPLGQVLGGVLEACVAAGEAEHDNSAVIAEVRRRRRAQGART